MAQQRPSSSFNPMMQQQQQQQRMPMNANNGMQMRPGQMPTQMQQQNRMPGLFPGSVGAGVRSPGMVGSPQAQQQQFLAQGQQQGMGGGFQPQQQPQQQFMRAPMQQQQYNYQQQQQIPPHQQQIQQQQFSMTQQQQQQQTLQGSHSQPSQFSHGKDAAVSLLDLPTAETRGDSPVPKSQTPPTSANVPSSSSAIPASAAAQQQLQQQQQLQSPLGVATVCRIGQETVQEIVIRIQEVFSYLKQITPPVGSQIQDRPSHERQLRVQEVLRGITQLFKRLNVCWERAMENTSEYDLSHPFDSARYVTDVEHLVLDRERRAALDRSRGEGYHLALEENTALVQELSTKNQQLKEIMELMRDVIWEVNTMLAMRQ